MSWLRIPGRLLVLAIFAVGAAAGLAIVLVIAVFDAVNGGPK